MRIPLGDILRAWKGCPKWLRAILGVTKGSTVTVSGVEIGLSEKPGVTSKTLPFDRPHQPGGLGR